MRIGSFSFLSSMSDPNALPDWIRQIVQDQPLSNEQATCLHWIGDAYQLLMQLNSFSLSEYSEQVQHLDRVAEMARAGSRLAQHAPEVVEALVQQQPVGRSS